MLINMDNHCPEMPYHGIMLGCVQVQLLAHDGNYKNNCMKPINCRKIRSLI